MADKYDNKPNRDNNDGKKQEDRNKDSRRRQTPEEYAPRNPGGVNSPN